MSQADSPDTTTPSRRHFLRFATAPIAAYGAASLAKPVADFVLTDLANELDRLDASIAALIRADPTDCAEIPGYLALEGQRETVLDLLEATDAKSLDGMKAKARVLLTGAMRGDDEMTGLVARSLAEDILRLGE